MPQKVPNVGRALHEVGWMKLSREIAPSSDSERQHTQALGALIEHGALETDELDALWDATLNNHASVRAALASVLGAAAAG